MFELGQGDAVDVVVIHAEADEDQVGVLLEDFGIESFEALAGGVTAGGAVDDGDGGVRVFGLERFGPALPEDEGWVGGVASGGDGITVGDDFEGGAGFEFLERAREEVVLAGLVGPGGVGGVGVVDEGEEPGVAEPGEL